MRGAAEEDLALRYMQSQGLQLVARNVRFRGGEIDLVMKDGDTIVITEVRKRSRQDFGGAAASVGWSKQKRIVLATRLWLASRPQYANHAVRFDVCALDGANRIDWLKAAFDAGGI